MLKFIKWLFGWGKQKTITKTQCKELICFVEKSKKLSVKQQVVECDKIYHHTLKSL